jgi:flagellar export protein FliJ
MKGFRLAAVLRARQAREDLAKTAVAHAVAAATIAAARTRTYQRDLDHRQVDTPAARAVSAGLRARQALAGALSEALDAASLANTQVTERRTDLAAAAAARRAMEHLAERHATARRRTEEAAEQAELDDLASGPRHGRRRP